MVSTELLIQPVPRIQLPVGVTTTARPRVEWKPIKLVELWQVRVCTAGDGSLDDVVWVSKEIPGSTTHLYPDLDLPSHATLQAHVRAMINNQWSDWGIASTFRIEPAVPLANGIVLYDLHITRKLNPLQAFAHAHLVSVLQGLVNRLEPSLYVKFVHSIPLYTTDDTIPDGDIDQFWLNRFRQPDGWLGESLVRTIPTLEELLEHFGDAYNGVVLWDLNVPATSNIASTIAAAEDLLPIPCCNDTSSLYNDIVMNGLCLPVKVDLRGKFTGTGLIPDTNRRSTGSKKCDAYLWAMEHYLKTGKSDPCTMGHYIDAWWVRNPTPGGDWQNHTLTNHDYFVARRGFFWDLNIWDDETPVDDPTQKPGTDAATLREIMAAANQAANNNEMIHVGGFTPWAFKYTNFAGAGGNHEPVDTEWELVRVLSSYNAYIDADALGLSALANASFFSHYPMPASYAPVLAHTPEELQAEGLLDESGKPAARSFLLNYVGDYDSAAWAWNSLSVIWELSGRGNVLLSWAINPNLASRVTPLFEHLYETRTASDHFMTGDSGAGYVNPTQLLGDRQPSNLPDAGQVWLRHCLQWYRRFGMRFTGFLINGLSGHITPEAERLYLKLSPDGIVNQYGRAQDKLHLVAERMPAFELIADLEKVEDAVAAIGKHIAAQSRGAAFMVFRQILKSPVYYMKLQEGLAGIAPERSVVFCDPHTFGCLARAQQGADNDDQAVLLFDATPETVRLGDRLSGDVAMRNDGWNEWTPDHHSLLIELVRPGAGDSVWKRYLPLESGVRPGESALFAVNEQMPDFAGDYRLVVDMARDGLPFSTRGGYAAERTVYVRSAPGAATIVSY